MRIMRRKKRRREKKEKKENKVEKRKIVEKYTGGRGVVQYEGKM